ncbi:NAD(P)-binding protein [Mytilinidion resinicola]|uniref:NAD(P)-binding protein n=1 Tax=Mytilinidion resinicola TaxID=574789 RepID=A0A6A6YPN3_9PEZI|nr:NAD(P)-binding protein [Mytilinidion resinicola]KAF2810856.1 NAD(P)-binding protein [Mytilinidion resinicola]
MADTYTAVTLAERPKADIIPGETFKVEERPLPKENDLKEGEVIFEARYLSLDPAMRGWLNDVRSYVPPVQIGEVMRGLAAGVVTASKSEKFPVGTTATGTVGWTEVAVVNEKALEKVEIPRNGKLTDSLGVLGMTGLTAYFGLLRIGAPKAGETVVVSGAAGATGSVVGQIAKIYGAHVIGVCGSDSKCSWLKEELGFDEAVNYKDPEFAKKFRDVTKNFIDVFFDNVGGDVLDLALTRAKKDARFVICGGISQYNAVEKKGPANYLMIISMRIRMQGFIVFDFESEYPEARKELAQWLAEGKIKRKETILKGGLKEADKGLVQLYKGVNTGKLLVEVKPESEQSKL